MSDIRMIRPGESMFPERKPLTYDETYELIHGHPVHYIQCQCSAAHTYGNVTAFIQNWLLKLFPDDLFKTIHVNSKIAHQQLRSTPKEFLKKTPPMFVIRPRIEWNDSNKFLANTMLIERQGDLYHTYGGTNLQDFFIDRQNKVAIKYQMNRTVMNFDVLLIFQTLMQQLNWASYFQNAVRQEIPFNLETCLESYLHIELLKKLSEYTCVPLYDEDKSIKSFLKYMNSHSVNPITYKLQGSSGNEEFYRYYPVNIDTIITNFATDEGEKVGHVMDRYMVTFSVRCEFYSTGFYYLFSDKINDYHMVHVDQHDSTIIPIFTDVLTKEDVDLPLGWTLYASPSCRLETKDDSVDISQLFNSSLRETIKFHMERGIPFDEFLKIRIRKQGKLLTPGKDYKIDFENFKINFINCNTYYTYKIIMMLNIDYINNLVKSVYNLP